ncbi:hypothetical protein E2493_04705 [Sphingomonas parva]|uniref:DUF1090 family protein n=1 Tax=Sphingomonas parva TaxID=2555898 RepID=A0A4Y8ZU93_9SPHN|nr:hypothetical protein [Sphingomonas parva]TFI59494.1 hypothetical protein E2493_04705 [Sphingomonas parva]
MNKLLATLGAMSALAIAAPAATQVSSNANVNANAYGAASFANRIARLDARLQSGISAGTVSSAEARTLRQQLRALSRLERQYSRNGLTQAERQDLQQRIRTFRQDLALADGRGNRYGSNDDLYDDDYTGQGGPYEEVQCERQGGIGGLIGSVFGGNDDCDGLQVGERVSGNLGTLPSSYRSQFRDGNGIVYRTDGRQIYQIDTRTNTVLRVYAMTR